MAIRIRSKEEVVRSKYCGLLSWMKTHEHNTPLPTILPCVVPAASARALLPQRQGRRHRRRLSAHGRLLRAPLSGPGRLGTARPVRPLVRRVARTGQFLI